MKKEDLEFAIKCADQNMSKLNDHWRVLGVFALTSTRVKHLINNLCSFPKTKYLELGVYRGATMVAACYKNTVDKAYGVDNFLYSHTEGVTEKPNPNVVKGCKTTLTENKIKAEIITKDFDMVSKKDLGNNTFNVINYDPGHSKADELKENLSPLLDVFDKEFVIVINNYYNEEVIAATDEWIKENKLDVRLKSVLKSNSKSDSEGWWGGICVMSIEQKKE